MEPCDGGGGSWLRAGSQLKVRARWDLRPKGMSPGGKAQNDRLPQSSEYRSGSACRKMVGYPRSAAWLALRGRTDVDLLVQGCTAR